MEDTVHLLDYLDVLRRRKAWLIACTVVSLVSGALVLALLPKVYRSTATIAVAAPVVSPNYASSTGPLDNQERLRAFSQQLVSKDLLSRVSAEVGLDDLGGQGPPEQRLERIIDALRLAISVSVPPENVGNVSEPRRMDAFRVSYEDKDPDRARQVTNLLATIFIAENSKTRAARAEGTSAFIAQQLSASQQRLVQSEARLRAAKESHMGELPEQTQANLATLTGLRQQLESTSTTLRGEEDRLSIVERRIDLATREASGTNGPGVEMSATGEARVAEIERALNAARFKFTPRHPEVQRLEEELRGARAEASSGSRSDQMAALRADPAYRQAIADRESSRLRIRDLQRIQADLQRQIAQYQARVESAPRVEQQLAGMVRDYELEKQQYAELSSKLHSATISENVERSGGSEQFTLLYPATQPTTPVRPRPLRVMLVAVACGLCLGLGGVFVGEYLDRSVRDVRDLKNTFDIPVLGEVARIRVPLS
jgi:polysaccharide chain length determinant protein (PEP-CTERM system associated)